MTPTNVSYLDWEGNKKSNPGCVESCCCYLPSPKQYTWLPSPFSRMTACWLQPFAYQPTHLHLLHYRHHPPNLPLTSALLISPTARAHCLWTHFSQLQTVMENRAKTVTFTGFSFFCVCVSSNFTKCGSLFGCFLPEDSIVWCRQIWGHAILKSCAADLNSKERTATAG